MRMKCDWSNIHIFLLIVCCDTQALQKNISALEGEKYQETMEFENKKYGLKLVPLTKKIQLRYWIQYEWKEQDLTWNDFVKENHLQDFVDENNNPLQFVASNPNKTLELIIKRGYRILNEGKRLDDGTLNKILKELNIT